MEKWILLVKYFHSSSVDELKKYTDWWPISVYGILHDWNMFTHYYIEIKVMHISFYV